MSGEPQLRNNLYGMEYREFDNRRRPEGMERAHDIKQLWQHSHEILDLAVRGFTGREIATILNVSEATVSNTINSTLGERKLAEMRKGRDMQTEAVLEKVRVLRDKALKVYHEILDNEGGEATLRDRKEVADTVTLELAGMKAPTKVQTVGLTLTISEIEEMKNRGLKAMRDAGMIAEVEVTKDEVLQDK